MADENEKTAPQDNDAEKTQKERDDYLAGWQRAKADFINYKKDEARRLEEIVRYGNEELVREVITVLDNFDLALRAMEKNGGMDKGIYMIRAQMEDMLRRHSVERIEIKPGDRFDPAVSEAVAVVPSDLPEGAVAEEIEAGYRIYGKVLRPARVKVSKGK